jgi:hypothetical protein
MDVNGIAVCRKERTAHQLSNKSIKSEMVDAGNWIEDRPGSLEFYDHSGSVTCVTLTASVARPH